MNGIRVSIVALLLFQCHGETLPSVRGHVEGALAYQDENITAELRGLDGRASAQQSLVAGDGSFEFRDVPTGQYMLRLITFRGDTICEQVTQIFPLVSQLSIRIPRRPTPKPAGDLVSVRELQRPPIPRKALRAFAAAQRDADSGNRVEAARKLEAALRTYPEFTEARSNLGVQYLRLGRRQEALEQFEKAAETGPPSATVYGNLSHGYFLLGRLQDAEQAARRAISLESHNRRAHYLLGMALARGVRPQSLEKAPEAVRELRLGAEDLPHAYIEIARIYLNEGDRLSAAAELKLYLQSGEAKYRAQVERTLAEIQR